MLSNQNKKKTQKNFLIDDSELLKFFCKLLTKNKIKFINQIETINLQSDEFEDLKSDLFKKVVVNERFKEKYKENPKLSDILSKFFSLKIPAGME